jgi:hypothetical protein
MSAEVCEASVAIYSPELSYSLYSYNFNTTFSNLSFSVPLAQPSEIQIDGCKIVIPYLGIAYWSCWTWWFFSGCFPVTEWMNWTPWSFAGVEIPLTYSCSFSGSINLTINSSTFFDFESGFSSVLNLIGEIIINSFTVNVAMNVFGIEFDDLPALNYNSDYTQISVGTMFETIVTPCGYPAIYYTFYIEIKFTFVDDYPNPFNFTYNEYGYQISVESTPIIYICYSGVYISLYCTCSIAFDLSYSIDYCGVDYSASTGYIDIGSYDVQVSMPLPLPA